MRHALLAAVFGSASLAFGLNGEIGIHDPSTVVLAGGKYYTFGTGGTALVSDDGWTWRRGTARPHRGVAPDVIHIGDRKTVVDDGVSKRLTLKKGPNVVRAAIVNAGGATDFCARFLDSQDKPLTEFTVNLGVTRQ
jgi:hypothetical protein